MERDDVASHLPRLLRFARSLTRSQQEGEALVEATLNALLTGEVTLDRSKPLRDALLEQVHGSWIPLDRDRPNPTSSDDSLFAALSRVSPDDRGALLLVRFEGLTEAEASGVLRTSEADVVRRLTRAERRLLRLAPPRVLVVDNGDVGGEVGTVDWDAMVVETGCEVVGPVGYGDAAAMMGSERPDLVVASLLGEHTEGTLATAEAIFSGRGIPLIVLSSAPEQMPSRPWIDRDLIAATPVQALSLAALIRRALGSGRA